MITIIDIIIILILTAIIYFFSRNVAIDEYNVVIVVGSATGLLLYAILQDITKLAVLTLTSAGTAMLLHMIEIFVLKRYSKEEEE